MLIGIDDTDSVNGMCTTYLVAVLIENLKKYGNIKGYPFLIRLNPNIKYKTRGNAALAFEIEIKNNQDTINVKEEVIKIVKDMAILSNENTNPGIVFIENTTEKMKHDLCIFSMRAVREVLKISEAEELLKAHNIDHLGFKNKRGLIGSLAASSFLLCGLYDFTYELIAYREKKRWGTLREIDEESVWRASLTPNTYDTVDIKNKRIVFAPHSLDPILFGIRGESENAVKSAFSIIKSEPIERVIIYKTNQNTDMHLVKAMIDEVKNERSYIIDGEVSKTPKNIKGGHVIFELSDNKNKLECIAFEPTKEFREIIRELKTGDKVTVYGSVKNNNLNLEKINITYLNTQDIRNPICCNKRMKSMGKTQGFRCSKCGAIKKEQVIETIFRNISEGFYEVPPCARRHLSKPLIRYFKS